MGIFIFICDGQDNRFSQLANKLNDKWFITIHAYRATQS